MKRLANLVGVFGFVLATGCGSEGGGDGKDTWQPEFSGPDCTDQCGPMEGGWLWPCENNRHCQSGWCVAYEGAHVCTQLCQDQCPDGWGCKQAMTPQGTLMPICMPQTSTAACVGLPLVDCQTTAHCFPVWGSPLDADCASGQTAYAGCWTGEKVEEGEVVALPCTEVQTWAHPEDSPDDWYAFPDTCIPDGWVSAEQSPCD